MNVGQKRLSLFEVVALGIAALLPVATFVIMFADSEEVPDDIEY